MATFNIAADKTFNSDLKRTFNKTKNGTFCANPNKTFNMKKNETFEIKSNENFSTTNSHIYDEPIGPERGIELSSSEKYFFNHLEIICTDIRSFIIAMYRFFSENYQNDCHGVRNLLAEIDTTAQTIINELFIRQIEIEEIKEASEEYYDDDGEESYKAFQPTTTSESSQWESYESEDSQNFKQKEFLTNQKILNETQHRLSRLNINQQHANSLIEGLRNVEQTEKNLQRFKNMSDLRDIFGQDDDNE